MTLLDIKNLSVDFKTENGTFRAVDDVSLEIDNGDILAIVGESGSGKSVSMLALMGLLPWTATIQADHMLFDGQDMQSLSKRQRRQVIGKDIAMIFQEPMTSLNPCFTVGFQLTEAMKAHLDLDRKQRRHRAIELLEMVGIPAPESRLHTFPHQLSGGMSQRVMIAMALACKPRLLIADEPTTALDVTIQAQILDLLKDLQKETGMALILITHDMGVVAETAHRVNVQYCGQPVESATVATLFDQPRHPYTHALLEALPERAVLNDHGRLSAIPGTVPGQFDRPTGCLFNPRCAHVQQDCLSQPPQMSRDADQHAWRCHHPFLNQGAGS